MEEKDNLEKAMTLMSSALKQYEEGKFDMADHSRSEANKLFDSISEELSTQDGVDKMRFGESRNFGMLYHIFESCTKDLYANDKTKLAKVVSTIKNEPVLLSEFRTYNAFLNPVNVKDSESYVNEAVSLTDRYNVNDIKKANIGLLSVMRELGINENVSISPEEIKLYEDIEYVITHKPSITNITQYSEVKRNLFECVSERNVMDRSKTGEEMKSTIDEAYDNLASKYLNELTNDEVELVESLTSDKGKAEKFFNKVKSGLLKKIDEAAIASDGSEHYKWGALREKIESKVYNPKTSLLDVAEMIEASEIIDE